MSGDKGRFGRRSYLKTATGVGATAALTGCLASLTGGEEEVVLQANSPAAEGSTHGDAAAWLNEYVEEETGGQVTIEAHRNGELGGQLESIENVSSGDLDMYVIPYALTGLQYKPAQVFDAPYLYDQDNPYEDIYEKTDPQNNEVAKQVVDDLIEETNIRSLGSVVQGTRRVTLKLGQDAEPPRNPEELSNYKMRAVPIAMYEEALNGLGAETTNIDFSKLPAELAAGTVQGQENPYNIIRSSGLWEHQTHIIETNHQNTPLAMLINDGVFQDLSDENQEIMYEGVRQIQSRATETVEENLADHREFMRTNGLEIVPPREIDMEAFRSATRQRIRDQFPDLIDTIEELHGSGYPG